MVKTDEEVELLRAAGDLVSRTLGMLAGIIQPGISTLYLDKMAEAFIRDHGAVPAFLGFHGFPKSLCTSINQQVVHGIPSDRVLQEGDIVSVDCGVVLSGYVGDSAYTFEVGEVSAEVRQLLNVTRESLFRGIAVSVEGNRVGDVSCAIQEYAEKFGYGVVRELVGHGVGKKMHESPEIPNYGRRGTGPKLLKNMVFCIEPMINMGKRTVIQMSDGWTICSADGLPSAHFELTVAVKRNIPEVLSTFSYIEEALQAKK